MRGYERKEIFASKIKNSLILTDHAKTVRAIKFSLNNQIMVTAGEDLLINITDVETLKRK